MITGFPLRFGESSYSPWITFRRMQEEMDKLFRETYSEVSSGFPPVNVWFHENQGVVIAELPGVTEKDIDVSCTGNCLILKGARNQPEYGENERPVRREREYGTFSRTIQLPFEIEEGKVEAHLNNGILRVVLPRREEEQPKKIEIRSN